MKFFIILSFFYLKVQAIETYSSDKLQPQMDYKTALKELRRYIRQDSENESRWDENCSQEESIDQMACLVLKIAKKMELKEQGAERGELQSERMKVMALMTLFQLPSGNCSPTDPLELKTFEELRNSQKELLFEYTLLPEEYEGISFENKNNSFYIFRDQVSRERIYVLTQKNGQVVLSAYTLDKEIKTARENMLGAIPELGGRSPVEEKTGWERMFDGKSGVKLFASNQNFDFVDKGCNLTSRFDYQNALPKKFEQEYQCKGVMVLGGKLKTNFKLENLSKADLQLQYESQMHLIPSVNLSVKQKVDDETPELNVQIPVVIGPFVNKESSIVQGGISFVENENNGSVASLFLTKKTRHNEDLTLMVGENDSYHLSISRNRSCLSTGVFLCQGNGCETSGLPESDQRLTVGVSLSTNSCSKKH